MSRFDGDSESEGDEDLETEDLLQLPDSDEEGKSRFNKSRTWLTIIRAFRLELKQFFHIMEPFLPFVINITDESEDDESGEEMRERGFEEIEDELRYYFTRFLYNWSENSYVKSL